MSHDFLNSGSATTHESLVILYLRRDHYLPVVLESRPDAEEKVIHTRFGSFPHRSLLNISWGSQIAASKVDGKGRAARYKKKRKREAHQIDGSEDSTGEATSSSPTKGFLHVLPPTPENWTLSLPHRTQVVYTPDYSYILQRLQIRPGSVIVEAGAGSGSFTHAAARAVFDGHPLAAKTHEQSKSYQRNKKSSCGHVYSFEYHKPRVVRLENELKQHGLSDVVTITYQDVYKDGFSLPPSQENSTTRSEVRADALFLDLPSPWLALPHICRNIKDHLKTNHNIGPSINRFSEDEVCYNKDATTEKESPPTERLITRLCSFSPCIEQVQRTVNELRKLEWLDIEVVEVQHKNIKVRRERQGLHEEGLRGVNGGPANVNEAVERQRQVEERLKAFHNMARETKSTIITNLQVDKEEWNKKISALGPSKQERLEHNRAEESGRKLYKEGRLMHRTEQEIKTHTSFLTFAIHVNA